jgi:hypothetical protein
MSDSFRVTSISKTGETHVSVNVVEELAFSTGNRNSVGEILPSEWMLVSDVVSEVLFDSTGTEIFLLTLKFLVQSFAFLVLLGEDVDTRCIGTMR